MPWLPDDERFLHHALTLAADAAAFASPNPAVGCVLTTASGQVLGEGAHHYDQRDHAEIAALKQAAALGRSVQGATAYVTLEPCSITGRTGPCADALISAGIARCVIATADPNPAVHGNGIAKLRAAGIEVEVATPTSPLGQQARRLNDAFAFSIVHGRPFVTLKAALSTDGKLAPPPASRMSTAPHWLTGEAARADVQQLRHASDAILTGIGTVLADNPSLTDRTGLPRRRPLLRIVLDSQLRTPLDSQLIRTASDDLLLLASHDAPQANEQQLLAAGAQIFRGTFAEALQHLHTLGLRSLLIEAGPTVNGAFLNLQLADKLVLYFAESELGPQAVPFAANGLSPFALQETLTSPTRTTFPHGNGEDIRITGYLHDPWK
ncbi:bifunctional diaminohydroxyphosphoribosylaminopyrimidine deaminase/5-amino-6-(5-phosphoribosylamino)uracil reductase RibD [Granulicella cerasi]|uniref:Riboflavin biosynthesis protein RibD n=1 Tax=Granulicella cerasi TaxID=741063 RepID=A0ABW1Z744_9BACT|nr:bifunctional diaminohydroxyphosphoribosylaminopyrimidine deaminase/5-amino-6-(5-phosphoribosylamino)uracil reductase RibD [Granulicella cerasi]